MVAAKNRMFRSSSGKIITAQDALKAGLITQGQMPKTKEEAFNLANSLEVRDRERLIEAASERAGFLINDKTVKTVGAPMPTTNTKSPARLITPASAPLRKQVYERLSTPSNKPRVIKPGINVVSAANFSERDDYRFPIMKVVGISRDQKSITIEPVKLTKEQQEYKEKNPTAYREQVSASSVYKPIAGVALRDLQRVAYMENTGNVPPSVKNRSYASQVASKPSDWEKLAKEVYRGNK